MKTYIYGLREKNGEIRYIGKANNPNIRFRQHKSNARKEKSHKVSWIKYCLKNNIEIEMVILEECEISNWQEREMFWISQFKNLTNHDRGGKGGKPIKYTLSYNEVKEWVKNNLPEIKSMGQWEKNHLNLPDFIPLYPYATYKYRGWTTWGDFLSTGKIQDNLRYKYFFSYIEAKNWCLLNNIKSRTEYRKSNKPIELPGKPDIVYKRTGDWINWYDFLSK